MHTQRWITGTWLALSAALLGGVGWAPSAGAAIVAPATPGTTAPRVEVVYHDPHAFSETRDFPYARFDHGDYLQRLQAYLVRRATPMLQPGERLTVTFTNIKLAGSYEPWHGVLWQDVRFMRDIYPPRMDFHFRLTGPDGTVLRAGTRKLVGVGYLYTSTPRGASDDPLRFDKELLAEWLRRGPQRW